MHCIIELEEIVNRELDVNILYTLRTIKNIAEKICDETVSEHRELHIEPDDLNTIVLGIKRYLSIDFPKLIGDFRSLPVQSYYYHRKYRFNIMVHQRIDEKLDDDSIINAVISIVKANDILQVCMLKKGKDIRFKKLNVEVLREKVPIIDVKYDIDPLYLVESLKEVGKDLLYESKYKQGILNAFFAVRSKHSTVLFCMLDHCIADGASTNILLQDIGVALTGHEIRKKLCSYQEYVEHVNKVNETVDLVNHWYIELLRKFNREDAMVKINMLKRKGTRIKINNFCQYDATYASIFMSYYVGKMLCEKLNIREISQLIILNGREFSKLPIKKTVGDIHISVPIIYYRGEKKVEFFERIYGVLNDLYFDAEFDPYYYALNNYPIISKQQEGVLYLIKENICVSSDFMGVLNGKEFESNDSSIFEMQWNLEKGSQKSKIYSTGVVYKNDLYIYLSREISSVSITEEYINIE